MTGLRTAVLALIVATFFLAPVAAEAQNRRAVRPAQTTVRAAQPTGRVAQPRPAVRGGGYYRPYGSYYRPYYYPYSRYYGYPYYGYPYYGSFSIGIGFGYPYFYPYAPYGYGYYGYPYAAYPYYGYYDGSASLRLQVTPRQAEVYVDGYYAGTVDDFDGTFQRLHLEPGEHDVQLYLPGHRNYTQKVYLQPAKTFSVKYAMEPLRPGDAEPVKPTPPPQPRNSTSARRSAPRPLPPPPGARDRDPNANRDPNADLDRTANADHGTIALRVQPGDANITIDGERWEGPGDGERLSVQLPAGVHNVQIRKDGFRTYTTDITVRRGETTPLNVALTKQ